ncbi:MAG: hypothetical protein PVJ57_08720 [Phycisphaerae bacterium]|jgi:Trk-type K+ transport system membrane component
MSWFKRPDVWFLLAVVVLVVGGAHFINNPQCRSLDDRDWRWFAKLGTWQAHFDCLSAVCGAGLLTTNFEEHYTPAGRWALLGLGVAGALLYVTAGLAAIRRLRTACEQTAPLPPTWVVPLLLLALVAISIPAVAGLECLAAGRDAWSAADGWSGSACRAVSATASLGWLPGHPPRSAMWVYATMAFIGGLGWTVWLLPAAPFRRRYLSVWRLLLWVGGYAAFLVLMAGLIFLLESPRGGRQPTAESELLAAQPPAARFVRSLEQATCAAAAGIPTESLARRDVSDGTRLTLAGLMFVGPLGGAAGGGLTWTLLIWALLGGLAALFSRRPLDGTTLRCLLAGTGTTILLAALIAIIAIGILVIETQTASPYQSAPALAESLLDATSIVAGGNLSSGLTETVTDRNLSSGIRQPVDLYQYGMSWIMAGMLLGRLVPLFVLCQAARMKLPATAAPQPPPAAPAHG